MPNDSDGFSEKVLLRPSKIERGLNFSGRIITELGADDGKIGVRVFAPDNVLSTISYCIRKSPKLPLIT